MLPYTSRDQLAAIENKPLSTAEISRLFLTVRAAWDALDRNNKELEDAKQAYHAGLKAGLLLVKELAEKTFNVKIPDNVAQLPK